ncbi:MAG: hypothetical protein AAGU74_09435 [Bacillota bacterium]
MIQRVTCATYAHISLSLDRELEWMYSFGRLKVNRPFKGGLVRERLDSGVFALSPDAPAALYKLRVSNAAYQSINERLDEMLLERERYQYDFLGAFLCFLGIPRHSRRQYICSRFVAELLEKAGAAKLPKPPELMLPGDFCGLTGLELVYRGALRGLTAGS